MKVTRIRVLLVFICILILMSMPFLINSSFGEGNHTRQIQGRTEISKGLPSKASYSSVEVYDVDGDGQDELYLGGAGRDYVKTSGIHAFEYDNTNREWNEFGNGLPDTSSNNYYGALSFGDVNNDGNVDLIAPIHTRWYSGSQNGIEVYTGDGSGGFTLAHTIDPGESVSQAEVADLDGDGNLDIAVSSYSGIQAWFGSGSATAWTEKSPQSAGNEITGMDVGDLNNDGLLDLVGCPYFNSNTIRMYIQTTKRTWDEVDFKNVKNEAFGIQIVDFDADGYSDVIYGTRNNGIKAWLGNGGGLSGGTDFKWEDGSAGLHDSGGHWQQLELQDLTGDGKPELIAGNNGGHEVYLYFNDQPKGWAWIFTGDSGSNDPLLKEDGLVVGGEPYGANFGDWDGDGEWDCAACSWGKGAKAWLIDGIGSTGGANPNNTDPITYPPGGETPDELIGYDDLARRGILLYVLIIIVSVVVLIILIVFMLRKKKKGDNVPDQDQ